MSIVVDGRRRLHRPAHGSSLAAAGHSITRVDIDVAGARAAFARWGDKVTVRRGDVDQFDDVIGAVQEARAERLINLSYFIGELAPCFQARYPGHG